MVETLLVSSTVPHRCKGWLRACALQPTSQRPQTSRWRGPQAWDPHGPCPTQGLEWTVQLVLLRTRGPGSAGGGSELKFRVSATGHSVCGRGAALAFWGTWCPAAACPRGCGRGCHAPSSGTPGSPWPIRAQHHPVPGVTGPGRGVYTGASSSPLCGLHTWVMSLQPQVAFPWAWEEGLPAEVDRFLLCSSGSWIKLYLKKTCLHKHRVCASLGWTLTLAAERPHSLLGATAGLTQTCPEVSGPPQLTGSPPQRVVTCLRPAQEASFPFLTGVEAVEGRKDHQGWFLPHRVLSHPAASCYVWSPAQPSGTAAGAPGSLTAGPGKSLTRELPRRSLQGEQEPGRAFRAGVVDSAQRQVQTTPCTREGLGAGEVAGWGGSHH